LPVSTNSEINGLPVRAFPCLKPSHDQADKSQIRLTVEADEFEAQRHHRRGVCQLIRRQLPDQERALKSLIQKLMKGKWLYCKGLGSEAELTQSLIQAAFSQVFVPLEEPLPYMEQEFAERLQRRSELVDHGERLLNQFIEWIGLRHRILKSMSGAVSLDRAMAYSDVKAHLERLMAPGFMVKNAWVRLQSFSRYLKAMEYRIEKLQGNGPRDRQSMIEFESLYKPYRQLVDKTQIRFGSELDEFGWLLEEWRVSLFAQPLGTREPVSLKRLTKRWSEIAKG